MSFKDCERCQFRYSFHFLLYQFAFAESIASIAPIGANRVQLSASARTHTHLNRSSRGQADAIVNSLLSDRGLSEQGSTCAKGRSAELEGGGHFLLYINLDCNGNGGV